MAERSRNFLSRVQRIRAIGGTNEGARRNLGKPEGPRLFGHLIKLLGFDVAVDFVLLAGGAQILTDGEKLDARYSASSSRIPGSSSVT